jgi:hypothetical protein
VGRPVTGVIVVGMHRSGTTAVTRAISRMGVPTAVESDLAPGWVGNPHGHWESLTLMRNDDLLLRAVDSAWFCPPPVRGDLWSSPRIERLAPAARSEFDAVHPTAQWVAKDPRICITLPFWRTTLARPLVAVLMLRHPAEIAASHASRDGFPPRFGFALWERYMHHALRALAGLPVLVVRYHELLAGPSTWGDTAAAFLSAHGVEAAPTDATAVVDPSMKHEERTASLEAAMSDSQRELAVALDGVASTSTFDPPTLPAETSATGPMFERLRRRRGVARRWRWRRYLNRDRNAVIVRDRDV